MMNITTRFRHYWSYVDYDQLYDLVDTKLVENYSRNPDEANQNFNFFTIDAVYTWQFAPGSFINVVYKSSTDNFNHFFDKGYVKNFGKTMQGDDINNLSLKVIYFLDYFQFRKTLKKKTKG